ncbi:MAG TPA: peptidoglycan recognition family protein [Caulobacteraceae bacterium]|nr:peptidoglycan recognition family protein [Caulobacteraceae bacterium]
MGFVGTAPNLQDMTDKTSVALRKGTRTPSIVDAAVLHQTSYTRGSTPNLYLTVNAHFVVLPDGLILQLHPITSLLWASNAFNDVGIAIEFVGNFATERGVWWRPNEYGRHTPTAAQIQSGRDLLRHLANSAGIEFVFAHRQGYVSDARLNGPDPFRSELRQGSVSSPQVNERSNCPGPDIWFGVGEWGLSNLQLSDGGPGYKLADGDPIPDAWRKQRVN